MSSMSLAYFLHSFTSDIFPICLFAFKFTNSLFSIVSATIQNCILLIFSSATKVLALKNVFLSFFFFFKPSLESYDRTYESLIYIDSWSGCF